MNGDRPFLRHDIVITGFLQHIGKPNALTRVWRHMVEETRPKHHCWLFPWNVCDESLAEFICRFQPRLPQRTGVRIYAYSWGGMTAINLAEQLKIRSSTVVVSHMVLSDPVYRHHYKLGMWRTAFNIRNLVVPSNVQHVYWYKQTNPRWCFTRRKRGLPIFQPSGHDLVADNPELTTIHGPHILKNEHSWMDDDPRFIQQCIRVFNHERDLSLDT